jgi:hypothetical protein
MGTQCSPVVRRAKAAALALALLSGMGCSLDVLALPYFMFAGEPKTHPPVQLCKGRKDKKKLLVLVYADTGIQWGYQAVDAELTGLLIGQIAQGDSRIELVPERTIREWKDRNADWMDKDPQAIGEHFDVDYILFAEITSFTLNTTRNQFLLQGHTDILLKIWDVNAEEVIFSSVFERDYPSARQVELQSVASEEDFRRKFLRRIARELSWHVVPHRAADLVEDI